MQGRRVVVTGMGCISPLGHTVESTWSKVKSGTSGITRIDAFDVSSYPVTFSGSVKGFDGESLFGKKECRKMDLFIQYGMASSIEAFNDAGLKDSEFDPERFGVAFGSGIGGISTIEANHHEMMARGLRRVSPFFIPSVIVNMLAGHVSMRFGLKGPNVAVSTACASGTHNIGYAARAIAYGDADLMMAGAAEMCTTELGLAGFCASKALSTRNDAPEQASRPWDADRDGFVLGDGGASLVLEEYNHAKARGARIYGEVLGFGMSGDAYHITAPREDGEGAQRAMKAALADASISAGDVGYVNAHATSTKLGDLAECQAVKGVFGSKAHDVRVSSTKSMTGHLLGAAGALESVFSLKALQEQIAPPTINLENPDESCDLNFVANSAQEFNSDAVMNNSFGFGGTNASLIFGRCS
ncbi:beta-ketoacyl-ACP synthase II [Litoribrevibacter albus]|nr:beta-ketoacyl-ACP synthase II [Litoribrevibacter albus]